MMMMITLKQFENTCIDVFQTIFQFFMRWQSIGEVTITCHTVDQEWTGTAQTGLNLFNCSTQFKNIDILK